MTNERQPYVINAKDVTTDHELYEEATESWVKVVGIQRPDDRSDQQWVAIRTPIGAPITAEADSLRIVRDKAPKPSPLREKLKEQSFALHHDPEQHPMIDTDVALEVFESHFDETCKRLWPTEIAADWELERVQALRAELFGDKR